MLPAAVAALKEGKVSEVIRIFEDYIEDVKREVAEHQEMDHEDLFGENPDDAYSAGYADGEMYHKRKIIDAKI